MANSRAISVETEGFSGEFSIGCYNGSAGNGGFLTQRCANFLLGLLMVIGVYCPTSINAERMIALGMAPFCVAIVVFSALIVWKGIYRSAFVVAVFSLFILLLFTILTPLYEFSFGVLFFHVALAMLICLKLRHVNLCAPLVWTWQAVNVINLILAALIVLEEPTIKHFFIGYYSAFYDMLVPSMLTAGKPVLTFGSHSLASFFFFLCSYLNVRTYAARGGWFALVMAVLYLIACGFLKCTTACLVIPVGVGALIAHTWGRKTALVVVMLAVLASLSLVVLSRDDWAKVSAALNEIVKSEESGASGIGSRYSSSGALAPNIAYIKAHPFTPIGIGLSEVFWNADSGPVEFMLRGSIPLLLAVYGGFWIFLRKSLVSRTTAIILFGAYFAFEFGFVNLLYARTLCFIPFVVVYLNHLDRIAEAAKR